MEAKWRREKKKEKKKERRKRKRRRRKRRRKRRCALVYDPALRSMTTEVECFVTVRWIGQMCCACSFPPTP